MDGFITCVSEVVTAEAGHEFLQMHRQIECRLVDREMLVPGHGKKSEIGRWRARNPKFQTSNSNYQKIPKEKQRAKGFKEPKTQVPEPTDQRHGTQRGQRQQQRLWLRHLGGKHIAGAYSHRVELVDLGAEFLEAIAGTEDPREIGIGRVLRTGPVDVGLHVQEIAVIRKSTSCIAQLRIPEVTFRCRCS